MTQNSKQSGTQSNMRYAVHQQQRTLHTIAEGLELYDIAASYYAEKLETPCLSDLSEISPLAAEHAESCNLNHGYEQMTLRDTLHAHYIQRMWPVICAAVDDTEDCFVRIEGSESSDAVNITQVTVLAGTSWIKLFLCNNMFSATAIQLPEGPLLNLCANFAEGILSDYRKVDAHLENFIVRSDRELTAFLKHIFTNYKK